MQTSSRRSADNDWRTLLTTSQPGPRQAALRWLLRLASGPYAVAVALRNASYSRGWLSASRARLPVISVGNLSVGGTGKSPMVAWLARWLRQRHLRVAVLSRGYGALESGRNDEALEFELLFPDVPHLQHPDRRASAELAADELEMQILLLDDGFQHRQLSRDLDIVLLDATLPTAAAWLLPGGLMREPLSSLARAAVVVLTRVSQALPSRLEDLQQQVQRLAPQAALVLADHQPSGLWQAPDQRRPLPELRGKKVLAMCAIGNPESFFCTLKEQGAEVLDHRSWPDHHAFTAADMQHLQAWRELHAEAQWIVCTMKDWVKLQVADIGGLPLIALQIEMRIVAGQAELERRLEELIQHIEATDDRQ